MPDRLTQQEERDLATKVIGICPELSGIGRTADQYVRDPRTVRALVLRVEGLESVAFEHIKEIYELKRELRGLVDSKLTNEASK